MDRRDALSLLPQDVVVLVKLLIYADRRPPLVRMAVDLVLSASQVHAALNRLAAARLVFKTARNSQPNARAAEEFLVHGAKYMFPATRGSVTRGVLTSYAAPPLNRQIPGGSDLPPVWPFARGEHRGVSLQPLYKAVPQATCVDPMLYEMLALLDALRDGRVREQSLAERELAIRVRERAANDPVARPPVTEAESR